MAEVGSAFVSVVPSAKGFGSKLDSQVSGDVKSSGSKAGKVFGSALKVGAAAVLGGAALAVGFLKGSIEEAREAQKVGALTESTIKATGNAAGVTAKQVGDLAGAISMKTGIDDETIQSGQNMLLTFKNIRNEAGAGNDIFDQTTKTLVDLSAAMGTEPKQAAIQLGKALNDPIKGISALSRVGVTFTEGQKKVIEGLVEGGKTAEAQKIILKELNSEFGGAAEAQATAGDKFKVAFGNLQETVGTALLPLVDEVLGALTDLATKAAPAFSEKVVPALEDAVDWFRRNKDEIVDTAGAVKDGLLPPLKTLGGVVASVVKFMAGLPGPVKSFGAEAAAAAFILPKLTGAMGTASGKAGGLVTNLRNAETRTTALRNAARMAAGAGGMMLLADAANDAEGPMKELKDTAGKTAIAFAVGGPLLAGVVAFTDIVAGATGAGEDFGLSQDEMKTSIDQVTASLNKQTGAFTKRTRNQLVADLGDQGLLQAANDMNIALPKLVNATMQGSQGIQRFRTQYLNSLPDDQRAKFIDLTETLFDMSDALVTGQRGFILEREAAGKSGKAIQAHREKVRDLANTYFILPRQVETIFKSVGDDKSKKNVRELAKQYGLTPKEIRTVFRLINVDKAKGEAKGVRGELEKVADARGNVNRWVKDVFDGTQTGRKKAQDGAKDVADSLEERVAKARANLGPFISALSGGISQARGQASTGGLGIGNALEEGVIAGFESTRQRLAGNAYTAVSEAVASARRAADAHSPSRKMMQLGRDMGDGLAIGLSDRAARVSGEMDRLSAGIAVRGPGVLAAAGAGGGGRAALTITNWDEGVGFIEYVADGRIHGANQLAGETARAM